jgi:hypothetical protein
MLLFIYNKYLLVMSYDNSAYSKQNYKLIIIIISTIILQYDCEKTKREQGHIERGRTAPQQAHPTIRPILSQKNTQMRKMIISS